MAVAFSRKAAARAAVAAVVLCVCAGAGLCRHASAQSCTVLDTGKPERAPVAAAALAVAQAIAAGDTGKLAGLAGGEMAANFGPTAVLATETAPHLRTASGAVAPLRVTYVYSLVENAAAGTGNAAAGAGEFICTSSASASETDFSIGRLQPGHYAFAAVDADAADAAGTAAPWELALLLQANAAGAWQLVGLYPHATAAAGHDGVWYWRAARQHVRSGQPWSAWLLFGEAEQLLRPAGYVSSTNLQKLESERQTAAPPALSEGVSVGTPLALRTPEHADVSVVGLSLAPGPDGQLRVLERTRVPSLPDAAAERARNLAAAKALVLAHPELRSDFAGVTVEADTGSGGSPFTTSFAAADLR